MEDRSLFFFHLYLSSVSLSFTFFIIQQTLSFWRSHAPPVPPLMDKSTASSQSQKITAQLKIPTTPQIEALMPPASQSMVLPTIDTPRPSETSSGNVYLQIIEDVMAKFSPTGKMSEIFTQLADKFKEKEEEPTPNPMEIPIDPMAPIETSVVQPLKERTPKSTTLHSGNSAAQNHGLEEGALLIH